MIQILSLLVAIGFFINGLLHVLLILDYPLGEYVLGGKYVVLPNKMKLISSLLLAIWFFIGFCYLNFGKIIALSILDPIAKQIIIFATIFLFFAIFSNGFLTKSKKERIVMTPFCLIVFIISLVLLLKV